MMGGQGPSTTSPVEVELRSRSSTPKVVGLATTKPLMKQTIEKLSDEVGSLEAYITADGIGG